MRLFSSQSELSARTGESAWLRAMLDFEAALAAALAEAGLASADAAAEVETVCARDDWDLDALGRGAGRDGTPVPALLAQMRDRLSAEAQSVLHRGATSQDVVDSAAMLVAKRALKPLGADLDAAGEAAAGLADRHRGDLAVGRTLLQQALPITFGLRAAGWLAGLDDASTRLGAVAKDRLAIQFGGAGGTLASLGDEGLLVAEALARRLELDLPPTPWQANRARVVELAAALGETAGAAGKVGVDVVLLAQSEVAEVAEGGEGGRSSTMPQKRNPVAAVTAIAAVRRTPGLVATLLAAMPGEQERAAGAWQSEAETLSELLRLTGIAVGAARGLLEGLRVFPERMRANLDLTQGAVMAESLASALAQQVGWARAQELVRQASRRVGDESPSLLLAASGMPEIAAALGDAGIREALDPAAYLGKSEELIERALAAHRARLG